jgi:hypothetical protein
VAHTRPGDPRQRRAGRGDLRLRGGRPILLNLRNRLRGRGVFATPENAPWNLGRFAPLANGIAVAWVAFIAVVFCLPPNELVLWTMLLFGVLLGIYWLTSARRTFRGPAGGVDQAS